MSYNFIAGPCDTDSVSFCKSDMTSFSKEEINSLIKEINTLSPEFMVWDPDGYFERCLVFKAKNYILYNEGKKIIKGSGLKDQKKPKALHNFMLEMADAILFEKYNTLDIYHRYIKLTEKIEDIAPWSKKLTITEKVLNPKRTNEQKVFDALGGKKVQEGDKVWVYFKEDKSMGLVENYISGSYDRKQLLKNLYMCVQFFKNVIDVDMFKNYTLKKNKILLEAL